MTIGEAIYEEREHALFSNGEHTKTFRHSTLKMIPLVNDTERHVYSVFHLQYKVL